MATTTYYALVQQLAKKLATYYSGTATSNANAGTNTLVDTARSEGDGFCQNAWVVFTSGLNQGTAKARHVNTQTQSSTTLLIDGTWASNIVSGDAYDLFQPPFTVPHLQQAIQEARDAVISLVPVYDYTLYRLSRNQLRVTLPSTQWAVTTVEQAPTDVGTNPDFRSGSSGWTLHANAAVTNASAVSNLQVLQHTNPAGAGEASTSDVAVSAGTWYTIGAILQGNGSAGGTLKYSWLDASGATLGAKTTVGTVVATTPTRTAVEQVEAPENAVTLRRSVESSGTATFYCRAVLTYPSQPWRDVPGWQVIRDGQSRYLVLPYPIDTDIRVRGLVEHNTLSADSDTLALDTPELRLFLVKAAQSLYLAQGTLLNSQTALMANLRLLQAEEAALRREVTQLVTMRMDTPLRPSRRAGWGWRGGSWGW